MRAERGGLRRFNEEVMRELVVIRGLLGVSSLVSLGAQYLEGALCGDSSMMGYSLSYSAASLEEVKEAGSRRERWRFKLVEKACPASLEEDSRVRPRFADAGLAVGAALRAGWQFDEAVGASQLGLDRRRRRTEPIEAFELEELSAAWSEPQRWRLVVRGACARHDVIHNLEGRVALMGLRRVCRISAVHGRRVLSLTDNMAVAMSFDRGRAKDYALNVLASRAAAYQLGCNIIWMIRYVRSEANATDFDSRAADRGEIRAGDVERGSGRLISDLISGGAHRPSKCVSVSYYRTCFCLLRGAVMRA